MKRLFTGLFVVSGAIVLTVGFLAAVELLLSNPKRSRRTRRIEFADTPAAPTAIQPAPTPSPEEKPAERKFSIKRTKSEVGYVYWILEGYGRYKCFILCDSWDEAVAQAKAKLTEIDGTDVTATVTAAMFA